ncbi:hypothetical protein Tco_0348495 [Tanacetum coccineum]
MLFNGLFRQTGAYRQMNPSNGMTIGSSALTFLQVDFVISRFCWPRLYRNRTTPFQGESFEHNSVSILRIPSAFASDQIIEAGIRVLHYLFKYNLANYPTDHSPVLVETCAEFLIMMDLMFGFGPIATCQAFASIVAMSAFMLWPPNNFFTFVHPFGTGMDR